MIVTAARSHRKFIPKPSVEACDGQPSDIRCPLAQGTYAIGGLCDQGALAIKGYMCALTYYGDLLNFIREPPISNRAILTKGIECRTFP